MPTHRIAASGRPSSRIFGALILSGNDGALNVASTPDHPSFAITDLDVRVHLAANDWTPPSTFNLGEFVVGQWTSEGNQSWMLEITPTGELRLRFTTDGTTDLVRVSTAATGFTDGTAHWVRATLDVDNGAAGHDVTFFTSDGGETWTQLGTVVTTAGTVSIFDSGVDLQVPPSGPKLAGRVFAVEIRDGIDGTVVANPQFDKVTPGQSTFRDGIGKLWTVSGDAFIGAV